MSELAIQTKIMFKDKNLYFYYPLQLSNGSIIYYSSREILKFNKNLSFFGKLSNTYKDSFFFIESEKTMPEHIKKIIQIKDKILCLDENLFIYDIKSLKDNPVKYSLKLDGILKLNEEQLLGVTRKNLIIIDIKSIIAELPSNNIKKHHQVVFKFPNDWYIKLSYRKIIEDIYMHLLPNNRLLLHFYLKEKHGTCKTTIYYHNKIYILDLSNYKLIHLFKEFKHEIQIKALNNCICIKDAESINIYNINDYKLVNNINTIYHSFIEKYNDNILIESFEPENKYIILYDLSDIKNIKKCKLSIKHLGKNFYRIFTLNNLNILAITRDKIYILKINNLNFN